MLGWVMEYFKYLWDFYILVSDDRSLFILFGMLIIVIGMIVRLVVSVGGW